MYTGQASGERFPLPKFTTDLVVLHCFTVSMARHLYPIRSAILSARGGRHSRIPVGPGVWTAPARRLAPILGCCHTSDV